MRYLVTGGLGFIGSAVVRELVKNNKNVVGVLDSETYAADVRSVPLDKVSYYNIDLFDKSSVDEVIKEFNPDYIMHLAAESHVDNSISDPSLFIRSNIIGTFNLLESVRSFAPNLIKFHHISTDEVYGDLEFNEHPFTENTPYKPSSPYSASKASSDHLVKAWHRTYGVPVVVTNCSNNFGPYQHPEKLIPKTIINCILGKDIPIYGKGDQVRDWLSVEDHAEALIMVVNEGVIGETYNIGSISPRENIEVVNSICDNMTFILDKICHNNIKYISDRKGHDKMYKVSPLKIMNELNWKPRSSFEEELYKTCLWYVENEWFWMDKIKGE